MILSRIFEGQKTGFYVDVGAHHPKRFSNTYFFYKRGWSGINIDATPGCMKRFDRYRKRDINLEIAIGSKDEELPFHIYNEPALNTFDTQLCEERREANNRNQVEKLVYLRPRRLSQVLSEYLRPTQEIDFLNIDVEGCDLDVIESNDWAAFRPRIVMVEMRNMMLDGVLDTDLYVRLLDEGYRLYGKTVNTLLFSSR